MASTMTHKDKIRAWVEENPLRVWRKKNDLAMMDVASGTGMAFSTIQQHEMGGYFPNDESLEKLAAAMDISVATLTRKWRSWYDRRPTLG